MQYKSVFVSYEEAQKLRSFFKEATRSAPYREAREASKRILGELESIRSVDYSPFPGGQILLSQGDYKYFMDVLEIVEGE